MSVSKVQTAHTTAPATSLSFGSDVVSGDLLLLIAGTSTYGTPQYVSGVSDPVNGSWNQLDLKSIANLSGDPNVNVTGAVYWVVSGALPHTDAISMATTPSGHTASAVAIELAGAAASTPIAAFAALAVTSGTDATSTLSFTTPSVSDTSSGGNWAAGYGLAYQDGNAPAGTNGAGSGATFDVGDQPAQDFSGGAAAITLCHLTAGSANGANSINATVGDQASLGKCIAGALIVTAASGGSPVLPARPVTWPQAMWRSAYR